MLTLSMTVSTVKMTNMSSSGMPITYLKTLRDQAKMLILSRKKELELAMELADGIAMELILHFFLTLL